MDCSICSSNSMPLILRPPRNTVCGACYEGIKNVIVLVNKFEEDDNKGNDRTNYPLVSPPNSCKYQPLANLPKWMNSMKEVQAELNKKISFLGGFVAAFRDHIHTDIQVKPGNDGPPLPAHRALLASRSEIFRNVLDSDGCKAPASDTITLPELNHEQLESLLEFLYTGSLPLKKVENHVYSLFLAADKYEIPYLQEFCERHMLCSLNTSNVLDVLEISDVCSNKMLKETSLSFVMRNMEDVIFSAKYEAFAPKNPHLCVEITRGYLMDAKSRRVTNI